MLIYFNLDKLILLYINILEYAIADILLQLTSNLIKIFREKN